MKHVLSIDQGTTSTRCLVVADSGKVVGRGSREITQHFPEPGWVEHDAEEIFERTMLAAREAIAEAGMMPDAIGITNQRETVVIWDRTTGKPVHRAIVWQDRRTARRCADLAPEADDIAAETGLVIDPYFSATKIEWLLEHIVSRNPELVRLAESGALAAGTVDSWLIFRLTNGAVHATDPTNASRTMLFDIRSMRWSDRLCARFGIHPSLLPEVRPSSGDFGTTAKGIFEREIPIAGVAGDQQAALFGQGCWSAGEGKNTYGTGAFLLLNTGKKRAEAGGGLLVTVGCDAAGEPSYVLEAAIFIAGAGVQWLRDGLGIIDVASETEALARGIPSNEGVYFVPALVGLGAPNWEPRARGMIVGLTRGSGRAHFARAVLESMAYSTADVLDEMRARGGVTFDRLRVDGGASENDWLMQFQADVLGVPVERPDMVETTALGAAGLAGIATGVWRDAEAFLSAREYERFEPGEDAGTAREGLDGWHRALRAALHWARDEK